MKLINNRFKIEGLVQVEAYTQGYVAVDMYNNDRKVLLRLYDKEKDREIIKYFIDNSIEKSQIKHKNLLQFEAFNLVESINLKRTNMLLYYTIAEYVEGPILKDLDLDLTLRDKLRIILDLMTVIGYLNFRGYIYEYLNPMTAIYSMDKSIKIVDLSTVIEYSSTHYYDDFTENFIAPEVFNNQGITRRKADCYSIGMMMKYLLTDDFSNENSTLDFKSKLDLNKNQILILTNIINNLTNPIPEFRSIRLRDHIRNIIDCFELDYNYDLISERNNIVYKTKMVGRDRELNEILELDSKIACGNIEYNLALITGNKGDGKSKLLNEISYRLKMNGRDVYLLDIKDSNNGIPHITNLIKQTVKNAPNEILNKYSEDFSKLLPGLHNSSNIIEDNFRTLNRITNYFKELSRGRTIYIIIDNFHKMKANFLKQLDYLVNNITGSRIVIILAYEEHLIGENSKVGNKLKEWSTYNLVMKLKLKNLSEEEVGILTKSILGISYIPERFSSILHNECQGNPLYLEYIIKHLYNRGELFVNQNGNWDLKTVDYSNLPLPADINKAIESQISKVIDENLIVLKTISIFRNNCSKQILMKLLDFDNLKINEILNYLIEERFIEECDGFNCNIANNGWQRIMYGKLDKTEREILHHRVADVMLSEYVDNTDQILKELIYHLVKSNDNEKALYIIFNQWNKLENKYSSQSIYLCEEAYKLVKDFSNKDKLLVLDRLVDIYSIRGNVLKTNLYLMELLVESQIQEDIDYIIKAKCHEATNYAKDNNKEKVEEIIIQLEKISKENEKPEGMINALIIKCKLELDVNSLSFIEMLLNEAIELSNAHNINKYLCTIYNLLGFTHHMNGNWDIAIINYKLSIEHSTYTNNILESTKPMNNLGEIYSVNHGNLDKALYYYELGLEIANNYGFTLSAVIFLNNLGELYKNSSNMPKALEYFKLSNEGALKTGDYKMIFLANVNLGSVYLSFNKFDKVYENYVFLEHSWLTSPIPDVDIVAQYNIFLGEYYACFGLKDLSIKHYKIARETCKSFNTRDYLKADATIVFMELFYNQTLNRDEIYRVLNQMQESNLFYERLKYTLYFAAVLIAKQNFELSLELLEMYEVENNNSEDEYLQNIKKMIDYYLIGTKEGMESMEEQMEYFNVNDSKDIITYTKIALGLWYYNSGNFTKSLKNLLKSLDSLFKAASTMPKVELRESYTKIRQVDLVKEHILNILSTLLDKNIALSLDTPSELNQVLSYLPTDLFNEMFNDFNDLEGKYNLNSFNGLLYKLTDKFDVNIDLILEYIRRMTMANRGHILVLDEKSNSYVSISSIVPCDERIPEENILKQSNKNSHGLLVNKNFDSYSKNRDLKYLQDDAIGLICVPINKPLNSDGSINERRKKGYTTNQLNMGYIYLETDGAVNRFDLERLILIKGLTNLIYLNIENNNLRLISNVDKLTGTLTRKYFDHKLTELMEMSSESDESFTVLMLDIDNFKDINDTYGHFKGDEVLSLVGKTIKDTVRTTDLVGRFGGEEFIFILYDTTIESGIQVSEKIRRNVENLEFPGIYRPITVSIGLSQFPIHSQFKEELIIKADQALYYAKNFLGKNNCAIWNPDMDYSFNRIDKLAGILTGNTNNDNRNLLAMLDIIDLTADSKSFKSKAHQFLSRVLDIIDGEYATLLLLDLAGFPRSYGSRIRQNSQWVSTPKLNVDRIQETIQNKQGIYLIDWDNNEDINPITSVPNWQSIMVVPLISSDIIRGLVYISVPLEEYEFEFNSFNMTKLLCSLFTSNL